MFGVPHLGSRVQISIKTIFIDWMHGVSFISLTAAVRKKWEPIFVYKPFIRPINIVHI